VARPTGIEPVVPPWKCAATVIADVGSRTARQCILDRLADFLSFLDIRSVAGMSPGIVDCRVGVRANSSPDRQQ
jgi:hypothetical protein